MNDTNRPLEGQQLDPVLLHARRELKVILLAFAVCIVWCVTWCYAFGYGRPPGAPIPKTFGMPSWVFWGILVPWLVSDVFIAWFCFRFMVDDPLGEQLDEPAAPDSDSPAGTRSSGE